MKVKTEYISPVSLWLVVRKRYKSTGLFIEPAWVGCEDAKGPVIFTSRILAAVYADMRNKFYQQGDSNNWRIIPLQEFDLLKHARDCGGELWCMMTFGLVMEDATSIIVATGAPRVRYVPFHFQPPTDTDDITFLFNQWVFEFIRDEFKSIGLPTHEARLEAVDEMDDATFTQTLKNAIERVNVCRKPTKRDSSFWGAYCPNVGMWVSGEEVAWTHAGQLGQIVH
jgi:hypothetical protein